MKTVKMNCASCGAPIVIPEDVNTLVCTSCSSTLSVDRGEGYITLKVIEKLAESIHEMGEKTSSAIKENAFVTQVELKRMQLNQLISMEEMKINTLQAEIRAVKRRITESVTLHAELSDLLLQENDVRMHIRSLKSDIAHLDPGWESSLDVIKRDGRAIDEAIAVLSPYGHIYSVQNRLDHMHREKEKNEDAYDHLEAQLLRKMIVSFTYPLFENLTLEQMEELQQKIPLDLKLLKSREVSRVNTGFQKELNTTLNKIRQVYPRRKVESQAGKLTTIDLNAPYPEEPSALYPLIEKVKGDLDALEKIPEGPEKKQFKQALSEKLAFLVSRAEADIPVARAKDRKRKMITAMVGGGVVLLTIILLIAVIIGAIKKNIKTPPTALSDQPQNAVNLVKDDPSQPIETSAKEIATGQYKEYKGEFVEVTSWTTYFRDEPKQSAKEILPVKQGDIFKIISDTSTPRGWFKVAAQNGDVTGYLAREWVAPIHVRSIPGDSTSGGSGKVIYAYGFSGGDSSWPEDTFDSDLLNANCTYNEDGYEIEMTARKQYNFYAVNKVINGLPEKFNYSLKFEALNIPSSIFYGLQAHVIDDNNFDALLIANDGHLFLSALRNEVVITLYDNQIPINTMVDVFPTGYNTLSVLQWVDHQDQSLHAQYAINGQAFVEVIYEQPLNVTPKLGAIILANRIGENARIRIDDLQVTKE
jgi:hypothetical protein